MSLSSGGFLGTSPAPWQAGAGGRSWHQGSTCRHLHLVPGCWGPIGFLCVFLSGQQELVHFCGNQSALLGEFMWGESMPLLSPGKP